MDYFDDLYASWPIKKDKANVKLAYDFNLKKHDYSPLDYIKAAKLWLAKASDFQIANQLLGNWLRDEKFITELDEIARSGGLEQALENAQIFKDLSTVVVGEWNRLKQPWWPGVQDVEARQHIIEKALRNEFFQKNWQKALLCARGVFKYAVRDSIGNIKLTPTIEWFCDIEQAHVSKILEGYFGKEDKPIPRANMQRPKFDHEDQTEISNILQGAIQQIKGEVTPNWLVKVSFTKIDLVYKGTVIQSHNLPPLKEDQEALTKTLKGKAANLNLTGYEPDIQAQNEYAKDNL